MKFDESFGILVFLIHSRLQLQLQLQPQQNMPIKMWHHMKSRLMYYWKEKWLIENCGADKKKTKEKWWKRFGSKQRNLHAHCHQIQKQIRWNSRATMHEYIFCLTFCEYCYSMKWFRSRIFSNYYDYYWCRRLSIPIHLRPNCWRKNKDRINMICVNKTK